MLLKLSLFLAVWSQCSAQGSESVGDYIGCFKHEKSEAVPDWPLTINGTAAAHTVENCLSVCLQHYFRYSGILNGQICLCGSTYGSQGAGECSQNCYGNRTQLCGSLEAVSVYATGHLVPGPPKNLKLNITNGGKVYLIWDPPEAANGALKHFEISASVSETYSTIPLPGHTWIYPAATLRVPMIGLAPATQYNVSLSAFNEFGAGPPATLLLWTPIREPSQPETPEVVKKEKGTITVRLKPVVNDYGPVTKYRIVISSEPGIYFDNKYLKSWVEAKKEGLPYYIAAELHSQDVTNGTEFVVGDGKTYSIDGQIYQNVPLVSKGEAYVSLGVVSSFQGLTKTSYSSTTHSQRGVVLLDVPLGNEEENQNDGLTTFLKTAIIVCGILLLLAIAVFVMIQRRYGRRRYHRRDQQELNIRGAVTEVVKTSYHHFRENSAFVYDEYLPEEEERKVDYYDMLHQKIWNIPRNFLELQPEVIGEGSFGSVYKGKVQKKGQATPVAIYAIQDGELPITEKRNMLEGIDCVMRGGEDAHIIRLVGTCESHDTLYVVLEHHPALLKDILLQSRSLQHSPDPKTRFCSFSEADVFQFIIGVAQGMEFLASRKIVHKQLSASNIIMADGVTPRITGFGIAQFSRGSQKHDFTRWSAHEVLVRRLNVTKSDIWSFGILLWEVCALGGTPYNEVSSEHVAGAVLRGLRLSQLSYIGDSLYQLMLQCWQIDLDERPTFAEVLAELENIISSAEVSMELSFNTFRGFKYENFSADLEYH